MSGTRWIWDRRGDGAAFTVIQGFNKAYPGASGVPIRKNPGNSEILRKIGIRSLNITKAASWNRVAATLRRVW